MASSFDLAPRLSALQAAGLRVSSQYRGVPSIWLTSALDDVDVACINIKGVRVDDSIVMVKLSTLEALVAAARLAEKEPA